MIKKIRNKFYDYNEFSESYFLKERYYEKINKFINIFRRIFNT